ncbi:MAG: hypothetical protein H6744_09490 [Deltaproteobacteria bacterium]|nr:hypothetical protein [Deltaproteobacteria bacterium]
MTRRILVVLAFALPLAAGCAHGRGGERRSGALILATSEYELHMRDGHVYMLTAVAPGLPPEVREVTSYEEFRDLYNLRAGDTLPQEPPREGVEVGSFGEPDCVRRADLCGRNTEMPPPPEAIRLKLVFPKR